MVLLRLPKSWLEHATILWKVFVFITSVRKACKIECKGAILGGKILWLRWERNLACWSLIWTQNLILLFGFYQKISKTSLILPWIQNEGCYGEIFNSACAFSNGWVCYYAVLSHKLHCAIYKLSYSYLFSELIASLQRSYLSPFSLCLQHMFFTTQTVTCISTWTGGKGLFGLKNRMIDETSFIWSWQHWFWRRILF